MTDSHAPLSAAGANPGPGFVEPTTESDDSRPGDTLLAMRHITKTFPGVKALDDVNLTVRRGEIHAICGENGAGKSTLMNVLSAVYPHGSYEGEIEFDGKPASFSNIRQSEAAGIAIIHQELALIPELSIAENIFLGNELASSGVINWNRSELEASRLLARVGLVENPKTPIKNIGVGKQQLVEIAKAMSKNVKLLILDEPTAALNETDSAHLLDLLRDLRSRGVTCIMISHKLNEITALADSITILRDGKTVESFPVTADIDENRVIRGMVGRPLSSRFPDHTPNIGETLLEVRDWTVRHPQVPDRLVSKQNSFHVRRGEIVGFAGLMGAGRTELARSLFGHSYGQYVSGEVRINGRHADVSTVSKAIRAGLAYVTEDRKTLGFNPLDTIQATTVIADLARISNHGVVDRDQEVAVADDYRRSLRTKTPSVKERVTKLSGGNQQKVVLAKWLFTQPEVLILDEPTRGIDVGAKFEIYGIIQKLADAGKAVVVISSELPELLGLCDRIYTIAEGRITGCLPHGEADQESLMRLMTIGTTKTDDNAKAEDLLALTNEEPIA
ncbi:multiple monosaccharide ABC transporter ATP-binding protein [Aestuariimicrobium kwangyangense]|uniref:multiple monosaccharide ABC transporter ATP-binding protein n=1 Tax=Aestuariimicrobium kwangyangense TaxID=396389 RepID=UPI0003B55E39|nr:multiple monosaccharide ABC transporter ATP-binding protein [Aestuariimicrobium kwangyangense]